MVLQKTIIVLVLLGIIVNVDSRRIKHHHKSNFDVIRNGQEVRTTKNMDWDFFMLVTEWPFSSCEKENATHQHECVIPSQVTGWILHGLWPSCNNGKYPQYCTQEKFDWSHVEDLKERLDKFWPNLFADSSKTSFWKHEYEKHGTCAASVHGFESEHDFFKTTLDLRDKYDMTRVLGDHGIKPAAKPFQGAVIKNAINKGLNARGCALCQRIKGMSGYVLMATTVCIDKSLQLVDCPYCEEECYDDDDVYYQPLH